MALKNNALLAAHRGSRQDIANPPRQAIPLTLLNIAGCTGMFYSTGKFHLLISPLLQVLLSKDTSEKEGAKSSFARFPTRLFSACCKHFTLVANLNQSMKTKALSLAALACSLLLFSCKKDARTVPVQLLLTDNPINYEEVNVDIREVHLKINDDAAWTRIDTKDSVYNLLDYQDGVTTVIAQDEVPEGFLKEVRFVLGPNNSVVVDGTEYPLQAPSAESSGLKIKIDKDLKETLNTFTLDFDAALSVKEENGGYKLSPVITLKP